MPNENARDGCGRMKRGREGRKVQARGLLRNLKASVSTAASCRGPGRRDQLAWTESEICHLIFHVVSDQLPQLLTLPFPSLYSGAIRNTDQVGFFVRIK